MQLVVYPPPSMTVVAFALGLLGHGLTPLGAGNSDAKRQACL